LDRIWVKKNLDEIWVNFIKLSRFTEELKSVFVFLLRRSINYFTDLLYRSLKTGYHRSSHGYSLSTKPAVIWHG